MKFIPLINADRDKLGVESLSWYINAFGEQEEQLLIKDATFKLIKAYRDIFQNEPSHPSDAEEFMRKSAHGQVSYGVMYFTEQRRLTIIHNDLIVAPVYIAAKRAGIEGPTHRRFVFSMRFISVEF